MSARWDDSDAGDDYYYYHLRRWADRFVRYDNAVFTGFVVFLGDHIFEMESRMIVC